MNDHDRDEPEDRDWEVEAKAAEREEKFRGYNAVATRILNSRPLDVTRTRRGMRLVVSTIRREEGNPFQDEPVEFTVLEPATLKVLVTDPRNFPVPTEGTLLGSGDVNENVTSPGNLTRLDWLLYAVGGQTFRPHNDTINRVEIYAPGQTEPLFVYWTDC